MNFFEYRFNVNTSEFNISVIEDDNTDTTFNYVINYVEDGNRIFHMYSKKSNNEEYFFKEIGKVLEAESTAMAVASKMATSVFWKFNRFWRDYKHIDNCT